MNRSQNIPFSANHSSQQDIHAPFVAGSIRTAMNLEGTFQASPALAAAQHHEMHRNAGRMAGASSRAVQPAATPLNMAQNSTQHLFIVSEKNASRKDGAAANAERAGKSVEEIAAAARDTIPAGRYGQVSEFADVACFLASQRASYVTGSMVRVDGGAIRSV